MRGGSGDSLKKGGDLYRLLYNSGIPLESLCFVPRSNNKRIVSRGKNSLSRQKQFVFFYYRNKSLAPEIFSNPTEHFLFSGTWEHNCGISNMGHWKLSRCSPGKHQFTAGVRQRKMLFSFIASLLWQPSST